MEGARLLYRNVRSGHRHDSPGIRTIIFSPESVFPHNASADRQGAWRNLPIMDCAVLPTDRVGSASEDRSSPSLGNSWRGAGGRDGHSRHGDRGRVPPVQRCSRQLGRPSFFAIPIGDMVVFPILVAAALAWRRESDIHKRLMLLATISILDAAVARWPLAVMANGPVAFFAITDLYILPGVAFDLASRGRLHPANLWGGMLIVASQIARLMVWHTTGWIAFVKLLSA